MKVILLKMHTFIIFFKKYSYEIFINFTINNNLQ